MNRNIDYYNQNAAKLARDYNSVSTEDSLFVFTSAVKDYKGSGRAAMDLGCGAGGDAGWLALQGWNVDAVDGSAGLLEQAKRTYRNPAIRYLRAVAPAFSGIGHGNKYDVILMAAFLFHFDKAERKDIFNFCTVRLKGEGLIHMSIRQGPPAPGRVMYPVENDELMGYAAANGLEFKLHGAKPDLLGRADVRWLYASAWRGKRWDHVEDIEL